MTVSKNGYEVLRLIKELGEAEVSTLSERLAGFDMVSAVRSLKRCGLIEAVRGVNRLISAVSTKTRQVSVYAITPTGEVAMRKFEASVERKVALSQGLPITRQPAVVKSKSKSKVSKPSQIPRYVPLTEEKFEVIDGRRVKVTKAICEYEKLKQEPDFTRHKPRPILSYAGGGFS